MKPKPSLAHQRKRPRYKKKLHVGPPKAPSGQPSPAADDSADEESEAPESMEARSLDVEAAYEFAGHDEENAQNQPPAAGAAPADSPRSAQSSQTAAPPPASGPPSPTANDPQAQRREQEMQRRDQERIRRDQERERRDAERRERERREAERRDMARRDQERRERERQMELRGLDIDSVCGKAWEIYGAEVKEEGVELFPDNDARELAKRSFRLAEIFLVEESRLRRMRNEPYQPTPNDGKDDSSAQTMSDSPEGSGEPTMGE
jgi:hypothetical protein